MMDKTRLPSYPLTIMSRLTYDEFHILRLEFGMEVWALDAGQYLIKCNVSQFLVKGLDCTGIVTL